MHGAWSPGLLPAGPCHPLQAPTKPSLQAAEQMCPVQRLTTCTSPGSWLPFCRAVSSPGSWRSQCWTTDWSKMLSSLMWLQRFIIVGDHPHTDSYPTCLKSHPTPPPPREQGSVSFWRMSGNFNDIVITWNIITSGRINISIALFIFSSASDLESAKWPFSYKP